MPTTRLDALRPLIGPRSRVRSVYQPIVDLETGATIGYEALARFPDVPHLGPAEVFALARKLDLLVELDWECRRAAFTGAVVGHLGAPLYLFVNVEPSVLGSPPPWRLDPTELNWSIATMPTVVELTERSLLTDPRSVLWTVDWARDHECLVALDDVGSNPDSVAMLDLVRPDIIKLDRALLVDEHSDEQRRTLRVVFDHVSRNGAHVLCEGVETEHDIDRARACGATLAQGFHFGRPAVLDLGEEVGHDTGVLGAPTSDLRVVDDRLCTPVPDPMSLLHNRTTQIAPTRHIARIGAVFDATDRPGRRDGCVLLSLHRPEYYTTWLHRRLSEMAASNALVGVLGVGDDLPDGVRGSGLQPIRDHFAYVQLDAEYTMAVVARDLGDDGPLPDRRFEWTITHDDAEVLELARNLIRRLSPLRELFRAPPAPDAEPVGERATLAEIVASAVLVVPGAHSAALTVASADGRLETVATSDENPYLLDHLQQLCREGPSLRPAQQDPVAMVDDLGLDPMWPAFGAAAVSAAPFASVLSLRLFTDSDTSGYLTLWATDPATFGPTEVEAATAVAGHAAKVWAGVLNQGGSARPVVVSEFVPSALSVALDAAVTKVMSRDSLSSQIALRTILKDSATTGTSLQQTAHHVMAPSDASVTGQIVGDDSGSDFRSAGSP